MRTKIWNRHRPTGLVRRLALANFLAMILLTSVGHSGLAQEVPSLPARMFLPRFHRRAAGCQPLPGASYAAISVLPPPTDRPAEQHADLNLALRGYDPTGGGLGLVDYGGQFDPGAPNWPASSPTTVRASLCVCTEFSIGIGPATAEATH